MIDQKQAKVIEKLFNKFSITNYQNLLDFMLYAIEYRNQHKTLSTTIAMVAFVRSNPIITGVEFNQLTEDIHGWFGALECPGDPSWSSTPSKFNNQLEYEDYLWEKLRDMILKEKERSQRPF